MLLTHLAGTSDSVRVAVVGSPDFAWPEIKSNRLSPKGPPVDDYAAVRRQAIQGPITIANGMFTGETRRIEDLSWILTKAFTLSIIMFIEVASILMMAIISFDKAKVPSTTIKSILPCLVRYGQSAVAAQWDEKPSDRPTVYGYFTY